MLKSQVFGASRQHADLQTSLEEQWRKWRRRQRGRGEMVPLLGEGEPSPLQPLLQVELTQLRNNSQFIFLSLLLLLLLALSLSTSPGV